MRSFIFCAGLVVILSAPLCALESVVVVRDTAPNPAGLLNMVVLNNNTLIFSGDETSTGREIWKSDGTAAGTVLVKDIRDGTFGCSPLELTVVGNVVFFSADDGVNGTELWKTDGTPGGTVLVKDIRSGPNGSGLGGFVNYNGTLIFYANDGTNGLELWRSDGTEGGTTMVADIYVGSSSAPMNLINFNNKVYFSAKTSAHGRELWVTDGTLGGTEAITDIVTGSGDSLGLSPFTVSGGLLYFSAVATGFGAELWKCGGTSGTTAMVKDINTGVNSSSSPASLVDVGGTLFFTANDGTAGPALWKTDGNEGATVMVKDILSDTQNPNINGVSFNGGYYFGAYTPESSVELWRSDGTPEGTAILKELNPGVGTAAIASMKVIGNRLYFTADDGAVGNEPWKSDGTANGTARIMDVKLGVGNGTVGATQFTLMGSTVYLQASDGVNNDKLFKIVTVQVPTPVIISALTASAVLTEVFSYTITATNTPTSFGATGLPAGISASASTGIISGTPTETGTFNVTISATNEGGTDTKTLTLTVKIPKPVITSAHNAVVTVNTPFSYMIIATNSPDSYDATNLPTGLSVNTDTGEISGTPTVVEFKAVNVSATNAGGTGTELIVITVAAVDTGEPVITSAYAVSGTVNTAFLYKITATKSPTSFGASGLPPFLTLNTGNGEITGTPTVTGSFLIAISATNNVATDMATVLITITQPNPGGGTQSNIDSDNDGYSDELEIAVGSQPFSASSTPLDADAGPPAAFTVTSLQLKVDRTPTGPTGQDSLSLAGTIPVPQGFVMSGAKFLVDVGGENNYVTLDAKGGGSIDFAIFKLKVKSNKGSVPAQNAPFTLKITKTYIAASLLDEGLLDETYKNQERFLPVLAILAGKHYRADVKVLAVNKEGKSGSAKKAK